MENQAVRFASDDSGEDFYEMIEAPKFVDFTVSDRYIPDDRYWFCSRVGCEENHPEELDSEVVFNNFVMRVMEARSPNVWRARRNLKCPLTAPPKSSKSRVTRLALISSISKRIVDARVKSRPCITKPTPNAKPKQAHVKAMTTPRNRKLNSNTNAFFSVKNSKTISSEVPKTTMVAKALVFQSPMKDTKKKTSIEMNIPVKNLCAAMTKLEITSAKKNVLGNGQPLPLDASRKKLRGREVKSRVFDSLGTHSCKSQDAKSARVLKKRNKEKNLKPSLPDHVAQEIVEEASDMDIDDKSRHVSLQGCSQSSSAKSTEGNHYELSRSEDSDDLSKNSQETSNSNSEETISNKNDFEVVLCDVVDQKYQENNHEEIAKTGALETKAIKENVDGKDEKNTEIMESQDENTDYASKNSKDDETSTSNSEEKKLEASDSNSVLYEVDDENNQERKRGQRTKSGKKQMNISAHESDDKENVANVDNNDNAVTSDDEIEHESETTTDENIAPNDNSGNNSYYQSERVPFGELEESKNPAKVKGMLKKTLKENSTPAPVCSHGPKPSRLKSTNPKPFRLRTDERVVIREANLGKKLNCPLKDITVSRRFHADKMQRKKLTTIQNSECEKHVEKEYEQRMSGSKTPDDRLGGTVPNSSNNKKGDSEHKLCTMDTKKIDALKHQKQNLCRRLEPGKERATKKPDDNLKRTKLENVQQKVRKARRDLSSKEENTSLVPSSQISARNETSLDILNHKDAKKPFKHIISKKKTYNNSQGAKSS